jgi:isoquinoline 1-oxidoreductase beta subunit
VASTSWAAERALEQLRPRFRTRGPLASDALIAARLQTALDADGDAIVERGDPDEALNGAGLYRADYNVAAASHASLEPMTATASWADGNLSVWLPTIAPEAVRQVVASRLELSPARVTILPAMVGGGFGRGMQPDAAVQAGWLARELKRPVQLFWSRAEGMVSDRFRPAARARLTGKVSGGKLQALLARIAAPSYGRIVAEALTPGSALARELSTLSADGFAVAGAETPYRIDHVTVRHHPAELPIPVGYWRSGPHSYTCFFTESFVDEVARAANVEPFSFRMAMLGGQPRLARCLSTVAALGGWQGGGLGTGQGLAVHAAHGSFVAVLVEAQAEGGRVRCDRIVAVADVGRQIHPDIVRQQIEGGLIFGLAAATGCAPGFADGLTRARRLADLNLPRLAGSPEITVELLPSNEEPGGASELGVPPVAPALANALFAGGGRRYRDLPLIVPT